MCCLCVVPSVSAQWSLEYTSLSCPFNVTDPFFVEDGRRLIKSLRFILDALSWRFQSLHARTRRAANTFSGSQRQW